MPRTEIYESQSKVQQLACRRPQPEIVEDNEWVHVECRPATCISNQAQKKVYEAIIVSEPQIAADELTIFERRKQLKFMFGSPLTWFIRRLWHGCA